MSDSNARVLVTGADGRIGRATVQALLDQGYAVTALSQEWQGSTPADRQISVDATDAQAVTDALADADAVVHLAAIPHPSLSQPYPGYRLNTSATFNVLSAAGQAGVRRAVIASSINATGIPMNRRDVLPAYYPLDEELPADLDDWYSLSKASDELTAQMAASAWGMSVVAFRYPRVDTMANLRAALGGIEEDPSKSVREGWSYLDVRDAARANVAALEAPITGAVVISLAADDTLSRRPSMELLEEFAPGVQVRGEVEGNGSLVDTSRARELLGFTARYSVHD